MYPQADTVFLIEKNRDITHRFEQSIFYIKKQEVDNDIVRYSDQSVDSKMAVSLMKCIQEDVFHPEDFIPAELLSKNPGRLEGFSTTPSSVPLPTTTNGGLCASTNGDKTSMKPSLSCAGARNPRVDINLGKLEQQESAEKLVKNAEKEDGSEIDAADGDDGDELDLDDDYGVDHYASDGGGDSISDNEAIF